MDKFFYDKIYNLFFPTKCGFCGNITDSYNYVCNNCKRVEYDEDREHCILCGKKVYLDNNICKECRERRVYYEKLIYYDEYKDVLKDKIISYKFNDNSYLHHFFAELLLPKLLDKKIDLITSVPISKKRMKERGYNQSELIAEKLAKLLEVPYKKLLTKVHETKRQSELSKIERAINIIDSFEYNSTINIEGKKVLLFDDVFTTGATVNECSRVLKKQGSKSIEVVVIALSV